MKSESVCSHSNCIFCATVAGRCLVVHRCLHFGGENKCDGREGVVQEQRAGLGAMSAPGGPERKAKDRDWGGGAYDSSVGVGVGVGREVGMVRTAGY